MVDGTPELIREADINLMDDKAGKPVGINQITGKRLIAAFGNSDGDRQMLEWTGAGDRKRLMMLVFHDDAEREHAYGPANGLPDTKFDTWTFRPFAESLVPRSEDGQGHLARGQAMRLTANVRRVASSVRPWWLHGAFTMAAALVGPALAAAQESDDDAGSLRAFPSAVTCTHGGTVDLYDLARVRDDGRANLHHVGRRSQWPRDRRWPDRRADRDCARLVSGSVSPGVARRRAHHRDAVTGRLGRAHRRRAPIVGWYCRLPPRSARRTQVELA